MDEDEYEYEQEQKHKAKEKKRKERLEANLKRQYPCPNRPPHVPYNGFTSVATNHEGTS